MKALVADDDRVTATMLKGMLERWGLDVCMVHDGGTAWTALQQDPTIALAILDWMMPGIEGPELCRRLRSDPARSHLYVLLLTARESRTDLIAGLDAGADDYLVKPLHVDEFRARVHVALRVVGLQARLADRVTELEAALSQVKQLHGLLPICSYCKKIRSDQNYWEQVDHYIAQHTDVQFSHGICPVCYEAVLAELEQSEAGRASEDTGAPKR